jgi:hypothetical protein
MVEPARQQITCDAIAATARACGEPKFIAIEASEAIALKHPRYESEDQRVIDRTPANLTLLRVILSAEDLAFATVLVEQKLR